MRNATPIEIDLASWTALYNEDAVAAYVRDPDRVFRDMKRRYPQLDREMFHLGMRLLMEEEKR